MNKKIILQDHSAVIPQFAGQYSCQRASQEQATKMSPIVPCGTQYMSIIPYTCMSFHEQ